MSEVDNEATNENYLKDGSAIGVSVGSYKTTPKYIKNRAL
jgi:hypothetical protein